MLKSPVSFILGAAAVLTAFTAACAGNGQEPSREEEEAELSIELTSPAFAEGASIPRRYTCDGQDVSPPLEWRGVPEDTQSLALIVDDPDAPGRTWVHWVLYGLPPDLAELAEAVPASEVIPQGARQGENDFKRLGYGGPCPPRGGPHRYFFKLYALDNQPDLRPRAEKSDLLKAMQGHILAQGQLMMGNYQRR